MKPTIGWENTYGKQPGDANAYMNGRIGKHNVVLCYLPGMGKGSAASVTSSLQVSYTDVELALVVGICEGHQHHRNIKIYSLATLSSAIL
jgi:nucleoside phosphorylase